MFCLDKPEEIVIRGDYSSESGGVLHVYLEYCWDGYVEDEASETLVEPYCKSRAEINEQLLYSNLVMLTN